MGQKCLEISLFGACAVRGLSPCEFEITGTKHKALFALLATAPFGRCTTSFLQETLWGTACYDSGRQSLRRALSDIKRSMGDAYGLLINATNSEITLNLEHISFIGQPGRGAFLEGIDLKEAGFNQWLERIRSNPAQIYSLYGASFQPVAKAVVPSISILPFKVIMGGPDHQVLGDWLAEETCRSLSRSNLIAVISHLSAREISKTSIALTDVRKALAVDYCISGSLRVFDNQVILDADFIDAGSGRILWTRKFEGTIRGYLHGDGEAVSEIVRTVGRTIASDTIAHTKGIAIHEIEDHRLLVAGIGLMHQLKLSSFVQSRGYIEEAIARAPQTAEAHAWLAEWYVMSVFNGWSADRDHDTAMARDSCSRALDIDPENAFCITIDGVVHNNLLQRLDIAEDRFDMALDRNPNEAMSWLLSGVLHAFRDDGETAVKAVDKAKHLSPLDPFDYFYDSLSASAYLAAEHYEKALDLADRSLISNSRHTSTLRAKICALHNLGRAQEAQVAAAELMHRNPEFSVDAYLRDHPASDHKLGRNVAKALSAAGVP